MSNDNYERVSTTSPAAAAKVSKMEEFYPLSATVRDGALGVGMQLISLRLKLQEHLRLAKAGDRERESRLINRIGQIRRVVPEGFSRCHPEIQSVLKDAVEFLRSQGRRVDLKSVDSRYWISARGGGPRW